MQKSKKAGQLGRRKFCKVVTTGGIAATFSPLILKESLAGKKFQQEKPETNIKDALKYPRTDNSMPGKFPGKVVHVYHPESVVDNKPDQEAAEIMVEKGMKTLTGVSDINDAWKMFVSPDEIIGLKVNPVAGKLLSTSLEIVKAVISQLEKAGIPKKNIVIWDRREFQLHDVGFTEENFPGITIVGTEQQDAEGSFYDKNGDLYGLKMIDKDWYYWADVDGKYPEGTLPYMVNEGKYSYFSKICTQQVDKIINIPILKNAGSSVTLALKNLAYGAISNTGRLHNALWAETCAEASAFPPLRDKVVLNIIDGIKGCFDGGPGAKPEFITEFNSVLLGTDPVAVDRIGYDIILKKRIEEGIQDEDSPNGKLFLEMASKLKLGESDINKIELKKIDVG